MSFFKPSFIISVVMIFIFLALVASAAAQLLNVTKTPVIASSGNTTVVYTLSEAFSPKCYNYTNAQLRGIYVARFPTFVGKTCTNAYLEFDPSPVVVLPTATPLTGPCSIAPCENGGLCVAGNTTYTCDCPTNWGQLNCTNCLPGYHGDDCENSVCSNNPCYNGGSCTPNPTTGGLKCNCMPGYSGDLCQRSLCDSNPCSNNGKCTVTGSTTYSCQCKKGYDGNTCSNQITCDTTCSNGGTCVFDSSNAKKCQCAPGYFGDTCASSVCTPNPCKSGATCAVSTTSGDTLGQPVCTCQGSDSPDTYCFATLCTDNAGCSNHGTCEPSGTGTCTCNVGYSGKKCQFDVCKLNPCKNGGACTLSTSSPGYTCACTGGHTGSTCSTGTCQTGACLNSGVCMVVGGVQMCKCPIGYSGGTCGTDRCANDGPCESGTCTFSTSENTVCTSCTSGYSGILCEADACYSNPCTHDKVCSTTGSGYTCTTPTTVAPTTTIGARRRRYANEYEAVVDTVHSIQRRNPTTTTAAPVKLETGLSTIITNVKPETSQLFETVLRFYINSDCKASGYVGGFLAEEETCSFARDGLIIKYTKETNNKTTVNYRMSANGFAEDFEDSDVVGFQTLTCGFHMTKEVLDSGKCLETGMRLYPNDPQQLYVVSTTHDEGFIYDDALTIATNPNFTAPVVITKKTISIEEEEEEDKPPITGAAAILFIGAAVGAVPLVMQIITPMTACCSS